MSFHAGLRASGNSSTAVTRPTRMSISRNWSKVATARGSLDDPDQGRARPPRAAERGAPVPAGPRGSGSGVGGVGVVWPVGGDGGVAGAVGGG